MLRLLLCLGVILISGYSFSHDSHAVKKTIIDSALSVNNFSDDAGLFHDVFDSGDAEGLVDTSINPRVPDGACHSCYSPILYPASPESSANTIRGPPTR